MLNLAFIASALGATLLLSLAPSRHVIEIRDRDRGNAVVQTLVTGEDGQFQLEFTHSMYGGTVTESYRLADAATPELERTTVETETGGAAEYYAPLGNFHREGAKWIVEVAPMTLPNLYLSVTHIGKQAIVTSMGGRAELTALIPEGHVAELVPLS